MPRGLHRYYGVDHLHFITCSCYRRLPLLRSARSRDRFLSLLEQTRKRYQFVVVGYVVMPEHIHLLVSEPEVGTPSTVMQVLKQRTARALLRLGEDFVSLKRGVKGKGCGAIRLPPTLRKKPRRMGHPQSGRC